MPKTREQMIHELAREVYIGDGVYAHHDGYQIWVRAEREGREHSVALDSSVFRDLTAYKEATERKIAEWITENNNGTISTVER
jgi:hypothetical protein